MMIKRLLAILVLIISLSTAPALAASGAYDPLGGACGNSSSKTYYSPTCQQYRNQQNDQNNTNPIAGSKGVLQTVTNVMALLTGIVAVVMIIVSGITFITAGGTPGGQRAGDNPSRAKKARAQLTAAVIGLVIVAMSWTIITFVVQKIIQ